MKYQWKAPRYLEGDWVKFLLHNGAERTGEIRQATTRYGRDGRAYHVYAIHPFGKANRVHVGEENLTRKLEDKK